MSTLNCEYVNLDKRGSVGSLYSCSDNISVCDSNKLYTEDKDTTRINNISIQRGQVDYYINVEPYESVDYMTKSSNKVDGYNLDKEISGNLIDKKEGFDNYVYKGDGPGEMGKITTCPEGYSLSSNGLCEQKCINCKYRDNMKSSLMGLNTYDPCFPNGVYNGLTNDGDIKCTCGNNNKYCSDKTIKKYTTDGMLIDKDKIFTNIGNTDTINKLFNFNFL